MTNPLESMSQPCPLDLCDGSGVVPMDDGRGDMRDQQCPCRLDEGDNDC